RRAPGEGEAARAPFDREGGDVRHAAATAHAAVRGGDAAESRAGGVEEAPAVGRPGGNGLGGILEDRVKRNLPDPGGTLQADEDERLRRLGGAAVFACDVAFVRRPRDSAAPLRVRQFPSGPVRPGGGT